MSQGDTRFAGRDDAQPAQQIRLPGVRAESVQGVNLRLHLHFFPENVDLLRAIDQAASE